MARNDNIKLAQALCVATGLLISFATWLASQLYSAGQETLRQHTEAIRQLEHQVIKLQEKLSHLR